MKHTRIERRVLAVVILAALTMYGLIVYAVY